MFSPPAKNIRQIGAYTHLFLDCFEISMEMTLPKRNDLDQTLSKYIVHDYDALPRRSLMTDSGRIDCCTLAFEERSGTPLNDRNIMSGNGGLSRAA